jgi:hypothetical protein
MLHTQPPHPLLVSNNNNNKYWPNVALSMLNIPTLMLKLIPITCSKAPDHIIFSVRHKVHLLTLYLLHFRTLCPLSDYQDYGYRLEPFKAGKLSFTP